MKQFEEKMAAFKKDPKSADGYYYLFSCKALKEWKEFIDYQNIMANKKPNIYISRKPQKVNEDLISDDKGYLPYPEKFHPCSIVCKPDLEEGKDYILLNQDLWDFFQLKYSSTEIKRKGIVNEKGQAELVKDMHTVSFVLRIRYNII